MVKMKVVYEGQLHCRLTHEPSGSQIVTDAPKDNQGKGEAFSPTDLVGAALGSCILTVMGINARKNNVNLDGATVEVSKEMVTTPIRRIGKLSVTVQLPQGILQEHRAELDKAGHSCPVHRSLHPDVDVQIRIIYPD